MTRPLSHKPIAVLPFLVALTALLSAAAPAVADTYIVCSEMSDSDRTRAVIEMDVSISGFEIVTPEHAWSAPDLPKGKTNVSPNLVGHEDVYVKPTKDDEGQLRILDFGTRDPDALELEGLRGSLVLHEGFLANRAYASLFYTATGNLVSVTPLTCEQITGL